MSKEFTCDHIIWAYFQSLSNDQLYRMTHSRSMKLEHAAIRELHFRPSLDVFNEAMRMIHSRSTKERIVGYDILAQLGTPLRPYIKETVEALLEGLEQEKNEKVIETIFTAIGHLPIPLSAQDTILKKIEERVIFSSASNDLAVSTAFSILGLHPTAHLKKIISLIREKYADDQEVIDWLEIAEEVFETKD